MKIGKLGKVLIVLLVFALVCSTIVFATFASASDITTYTSETFDNLNPSTTSYTASKITSYFSFNSAVRFYISGSSSAAYKRYGKAEFCTDDANKYVLVTYEDRVGSSVPYARLQTGEQASISDSTLTKSAQDISNYKYMMFEVDVMAPTGKFFSAANIDLQADYANSNASVSGTWSTDATNEIVCFKNGSDGSTYLQCNGDTSLVYYVNPYKFTRIQVIVENVTEDAATSYQIKTHVYVDGNYWFTKEATNEKAQSSYYNSTPNAVFNEARINFESNETSADSWQSMAIDNLAWKTVPAGSSTDISDLVYEDTAEKVLGFEYVSDGKTVTAYNDTSIANVMAQADAGTTVKLLSDCQHNGPRIVVSKNNMTLDLNGYTIDATIDRARRDAGLFDISKSNTFTLTSSRVGGKIFSAALDGTADPVLVPRDSTTINVIGRDADGNNTLSVYGGAFIRDYNCSPTVHVDGGEYYKLSNSDYGIIQLQKNFTCTVKNAFFYHNASDSVDGVFTFNGRFCVGGTTVSNATIDNCVIISNINTVSHVYNNANVVITNSYISGDMNPATFSNTSQGTQTAGVVTLGEGCAVNGSLASNVVLSDGLIYADVKNLLSAEAKHNVFTEVDGKIVDESFEINTYNLDLEFDRFVASEDKVIPVVWKDANDNTIATTNGVIGYKITYTPYDQFVENEAFTEYIKDWVDAVPDEWNETMTIPADYEGDNYVLTYKEGGKSVPYKATFLVLFNIAAETDTKANIFIPHAPEGIEFTSVYIGDKLVFGTDEEGNVVDWEDVYLNDEPYHLMSERIGVISGATDKITATINYTCGGKNLTTTRTTDMATYCNNILSTAGYSESARDLVVNIANYLVSCVDLTGAQYTDVTTALAEVVAANSERIITPSDSVLVLPDTQDISKYLYSVHIAINDYGPSFVFTLTDEGKAAGVELSTAVGNASDESYTDVGYIKTGNDRLTNVNRTTITVTPVGESPVSLTYNLANYCKALEGTEGEAVSRALYGFVRSQMIYKNISDISVEKSSSYGPSITANIGEEIEYSVKVTNYEDVEKTFSVTDAVPANTTYVSGAESISDGKLSWNVTVPSGESVTVSYKVKIDENAELYDGGVVESTTASAGNMEATANPVYIERTFNVADRKYIDIAIDALATSSFDNVTLAKWIYYVAYSQGTGLSYSDTVQNITCIVDGTASAAQLDKVAPTLYGGAKISGQIEGIKGEPAKIVYASDLIVGDIIITETDGVGKCYMYASDGLYSLDCGCERVNTDAVLYSLPSSDTYAVFRPSAGYTNFTPTDLNHTPDVLTDKQQVIVDTAKYYLQRGEMLQYDDTYFTYQSSEFGNESRWEAGISAPEERTSQDIGYINCAAFTHDVYWSVFGVKLPSSMYTTANLTNNSAKNDMNMYSFTREKTDTHTDAEKEQVKNDFLNTLEPGDIMVVLRGTSGHAMLYIGDGLFIHSTGSSYNYSGSYGVETYEPTIRYNRVMDYFFNENSTNGYVFGNVTSLCIVRPLNNAEWANYEVNENAQNRVDNLMGITAEKLPSVGKAVTVNAGDEITYTFSIRNDNKTAKTLEITDKVPANTVYVSGGDRVEGDMLYWTVTVPAESTTKVSYTVKVAEDTPYGTEIVSNDATIGGVVHKCYSTYVRRTLTAAEQQAIIDAVAAIKEEGTTLTSIELVNEIYKRALGVENVFADTDLTTITIGENGIFTSDGLGLFTNGKQAYEVNSDGAYYGYIAPGLYGGRSIASEPNENVRTELAKKEHLVIGDVFIGRTNSSLFAYIYLGGDHFVSLSTLDEITNTVDAQLERGPAYVYFYAIARPSFATEE